MHAAGEVSVSPHACVRTCPVTCFHFPATAACTAMPPPSVMRSWLKSSSAKPGVFSKALNNVFTPVMNEKRCFFSSATNAGKSRGFVINTFFHPSMMNSRQFAVSAKM